MAQGWIVKRGEKANGPFSSQQLKSLAASGKLKPTDLVGKADGGKFVPATRVKGLFPEQAAPTAAAPKPAPSAAPKAAAKAAPTAAPKAASKPAPQAAPKVRPKTKPNAEPKAKPKTQKTKPPGDDFSDLGEFEAESADEDYEAVAVVDDYEDDYEEDAPAQRRGRRPPVNGKRRPPGPGKKSAAKSKGKKQAAEDEEGDDGENPWANLAWGVACLGLGIFLFIAAMNAESSGEEIDFGRKGRLFELIYNIVGKWGMLAFFVVISLLFFGTCIQKWSRKR